MTLDNCVNQLLPDHPSPPPWGGVRVGASWLLTQTAFGDEEGNVPGYLAELKLVVTSTPGRQGAARDRGDVCPSAAVPSWVGRA